MQGLQKLSKPEYFKQRLFGRLPKTNEWHANKGMRKKWNPGEKILGKKWNYRAYPGHEAYTVTSSKRGNTGHATGASQIDKFQFK